MPALAPAEQRVANAVLADPGGVAAMTISELAEVASTSETTVIRFCKQIDVDALAKVVDAVVNAPRVDLYGFAASAFVALDLQQKLHRIRRVAFAWSDVHIALTSAALLGEGDVAIGISHTGTTVEVVEALEEAAKHGATTVAVTNFPRSPLAKMADLVLTTAARETTYRSGAMASRIAQLTVIDCLFIGVAQQVLPDARKALEETASAVRGHRLKGSE